MESIIQQERNICYECGSPATDTHHCLHGCRRKTADRMGLTVRLCHACHMELHNNQQMDRRYEQLAQLTYEIDHTRKEWMDLVGRNYR